jgi:hypothetical protein
MGLGTTVKLEQFGHYTGDPFEKKSKCQFKRENEDGKTMGVEVDQEEVLKVVFWNQEMSMVVFTKDSNQHPIVVRGKWTKILKLLNANPTAKQRNVIKRTSNAE